MIGPSGFMQAPRANEEFEYKHSYLITTNEVRISKYPHLLCYMWSETNPPHSDHIECKFSNKAEAENLYKELKKLKISAFKNWMS